MASNESSLATQKVFYAIKSRYPQMEDEQVVKMVNVILDQVAKRIGSGDALAFFHLGENDQAEIITYSMETNNKKPA